MMGVLLVLRAALSAWMVNFHLNYTCMLIYQLACIIAISKWIVNSVISYDVFRFSLLFCSPSFTLWIYISPIFRCTISLSKSHVFSCSSPIIPTAPLSEWSFSVFCLLHLLQGNRELHMNLCDWHSGFYLFYFYPFTHIYYLPGFWYLRLQFLLDPTWLFKKALSIYVRKKCKRFMYLTYQLNCIIGSFGKLIV